MSAVVDFVRTIPATNIEAAIIATKALARSDASVVRVKTTRRVEHPGPGLIRVTLAVEIDS